MRFPLAVCAVPALRQDMISGTGGAWAGTGASLAAGKQNGFVPTSRILYFYSHDFTGPYSLILE